MLIFSDLIFLIDKLFHETNLDFSKLDKIIENVGITLEKTLKIYMTFSFIWTKLNMVKTHS